MLFKKIPGYPNYSVTKTGIIKNDVTNFTLGYKLDRYGYWCLHIINKEGKRKDVTVHRMVAITYLENKNNKPQVNHKDGNKLNNSVENLEWVTAKENIIHSYKKTT